MTIDTPDQRTGTGTIRVLIVDDERLFAELLRVAMKNATGIDVVDVVHDVTTAVRRMSELRPDVVLADYHLPDGTGADIARTVRATLPDTSVLILTGDPSVSTLSDVARSGAVGHLTKDRPFEEVVEGVRAASLGEILFAPSELQRLLLERDTRPRPLEPLTARELEVLQLLAEGASTVRPRPSGPTSRRSCASWGPIPAWRRWPRRPGLGSSPLKAGPVTDRPPVRRRSHEPPPAEGARPHSIPSSFG